MMRTAFELKIELLKQEVLPECICRGFACGFRAADTARVCWWVARLTPMAEYQHRSGTSQRDQATHEKVRKVSNREQEKARPCTPKMRGWLLPPTTPTASLAANHTTYARAHAHTATTAAYVYCTEHA